MGMMKTELCSTIQDKYKEYKVIDFISYDKYTPDGFPQNDIYSLKG